MNAMYGLTTWIGFDWADPFLLASQLDEDERMISDAARAFAQAELLPRVEKAILETVNTHEGTHDVHALIPGRAQTGTQTFF